MSRISWRQRSIAVSYKAMPSHWCIMFCPEYARLLPRSVENVLSGFQLSAPVRGFHKDTMRKCQYLLRAVDHGGDVHDNLVQSRRDRKSAKRFFRKLMKE